MSIKAAVSDHKTVAMTFPASTAIAVGDLLGNNSGTVKKASAYSDQGTEAANQAAFAAVFMGVSADQRLVTETDTPERVVLTDVIVDVTCPSTTWVVGDLVGPSEASNGTELENQQVEQVTVATRAIGYCVKGGTSLTTVRCRLISFYLPNVVYRGNLNAALADNVPLVLGTGSDVNLLWSTGDASDHSLVLGLGDTSQMLHVTDLAAIATDWNITSPTHPTVYIHSNTTPITDYLSIGNHDGTTAVIDVVGGTTLAFHIASAADVSISANQLNVLDGSSLIVGGSTPQTVGAAGTAQVLGTAAADSNLIIGCWSATDTTRGELSFVKSGAAAIGTLGIVANGENLGGIVWYGDDGVDLASKAASIEALVSAAPGVGDMAGILTFNTSTDGGETPVRRASISSDGLRLGLAGTTQGNLLLDGATSGTITVTGAAAAGTWTFTLPPDNGDAGEQLQTDGNGVSTWEAAGSLRAVKNVIGEISGRAGDALRKLLNVGVYDFQYKEKGRPTTGDYQTHYTGVMAEELPEVMHHGGRIFSPVSAFGMALLAIKALAGRVEQLEAAAG